MGDKPIIRIAVPGDTAEAFMQAAAKQFRGDFFVAIDQPVGKFVRIEAPFLNGDVGVRGDAIAMPAVRNGRKGLVIRLVRLDPDSLGIPIQESSKALGIEEEDDAVEEFDSSQSTVASGVSAAVAKSIRSSAPAKPMAASAPPQAVPKPVAKTASKPTKLEDLDDEAREAVNEFGEASTKASALSADLAKQLAEPAPVAAHAVRRATPDGGVPTKPPPPKGLPDLPPGADDDAGLDSAFSDEPAALTDTAPKSIVTEAVAEVPEFDLDASEPADPEPEPKAAEPAPKAAEPAPKAAAPESEAVLKATKPEPKSATKAEAKAVATTDLVDKLPAVTPQHSSKSRAPLLIVLMIIAVGAGIVVWRGVI